MLARCPRARIWWERGCAEDACLGGPTGSGRSPGRGAGRKARQQWLPLLRACRGRPLEGGRRGIRRAGAADREQGPVLEPR